MECAMAKICSPIFMAQFEKQHVLQLMECAMAKICSPVFMAQFEKQHVYLYIKNKSIL